MFDIYQNYEDAFIAPPAKRQKILLCDTPLSPLSPLQDPDSVTLGTETEVPAVPFSIKWNQHPETPAAFPSRHKEPVEFDSINPPEESFHVPDEKTQPPVQLHHSSFSELLETAPPVNTAFAMSLLKTMPVPLPEMPIETVMAMFNNEFKHAPTSNDDHSCSCNVTVDGPYETNNWYVSGLASNTPYDRIKSAIECLFNRCRRESNINARFVMILENQFRAAVGEQIKGRLWDVSPRKVAEDIYNQIARFSSSICLNEDQLYLRSTVYLQEPSATLLSDDDVKKKRSVITIYENEEASLIYAFYVALQRNAIVRKKKATTDPKRKKELENRLTNVYRKGRKSLKKKTQHELDKSKVTKSIDEIWGFDDIPLLEFKLKVRCVVFSATGKCLYEGGYDYESNEIDLLFINNKFHVLASRNVFRNFSTTAQSVKIESYQ